MLSLSLKMLHFQLSFIFFSMADHCCSPIKDSLTLVLCYITSKLEFLKFLSLSEVEMPELQQNYYYGNPDSAPITYVRRLYLKYLNYFQT